MTDLSEHYYAVAADLEQRARYYLEIAEMLNRCADWMCEQKIREKREQAKQP